MRRLLVGSTDLDIIRDLLAEAYKEHVSTLYDMKNPGVVTIIDARTELFIEHAMTKLREHLHYPPEDDRAKT